MRVYVNGVLYFGVVLDVCGILLVLFMKKYDLFNVLINCCFVIFIIEDDCVFYLIF